MKTILLIGLGRFGKHIAKELNEIGHEVMAVDIKEDKVNAVLPFVTNALIGDSTNEEFLSSLGIRDFDVCIVTIGDNFQTSLETAALLKELGAAYVVSRASGDVHAKFLLRNGADDIMYPEKQLAAWCAIKFSSEHVFDYIELSEDCSIFEVDTPTQWVGESIGDLNIRRKYDITILGIKKGEKLNLNVSYDTVLSGNENLLVLGENRKIRKCFKL